MNVSSILRKFIINCPHSEHKNEDIRFNPFGFFKFYFCYLVLFRTSFNYMLSSYLKLYRKPENACFI